MRRRGLLLDRDGVINEDHGYISTFDRFAFKADLFPFLRKAQDFGYRLALVTNQSGVARGYYSHQDYEKLTSQMQDALAREGIVFDLILASFTHPEGVVADLKRDSFWRKPNAGMVLEAAMRLNLDLARSVMVGDKITDMQAALAAGVGRCFMLDGEPMDDPAVTPVHGFKEIEAAGIF